MKIFLPFVLAGVGLAVALPASAAASDCPPPVTAAVLKAHPGASVGSCRREGVKGQTQYEVKLVAPDGKQVELDVAGDGKILVTEEPVGVDELPPAVLVAFSAKYGAVKPTKASAETSADGRVQYELAFAIDGSKKEATFASDGTFLEEE